jgi:acyl carrier protein
VTSGQGELGAGARDIRSQVKDFIVSGFGADHDLQGLAPEADLIGSGIVDSMGVLQIVTFIERTYGARVADDEITLKNFRTIDAIARFVGAKTTRQ